MKKILSFTVLSSFVIMLNATVFIDETFNYSVINLASESSWTTSGTLTTGSGRNIVSSALSYSNNGKTYILSGVGKTLNSDISAATDYKSYKPFSTSTVNSGAVYLSFLYKAGVTQGQTNSEVMGLADGTSQGPRLWAGKGINNTANYRFGLTRGVTTGASIIWGTDEYSDINQTILVIIKYDFATTTASVFINPELGTTTEPTATIVDNTTSTFRTQLNNLWFRSQGSSFVKFNVGGIRVASSWAEVVADKNTPKLDTPIVGTASEITGESFTANWTTVANAQGYAVKLYQSSSLIGTFIANGASTSSLAITGLIPNTTYTYKVNAKGDGSNFSDSDDSQASESFTTLNTGIEAFVTNFGDGTWGETAASYTSGSYPSSTINGFNLVKAFLQSSSLTCLTGEVHTNRILLDKSSQNAALEFPTLKTVGEIEIHAATGTDAMSFRLEEWVNNQWQILNTYITRKSPDSIYVIPLVRNENTKLRIANNTSSGLYIYKILTRSFQETIDLNLKSSSPTENEVVFSNLKKIITLTFNKNLEKLDGIILLNEVSIPFSSCTITNNVVTIPVTLTTTTGSNKNYTLSVSAGAFGEAGNLTNLSKAITINFQTIKSVSYPANFNGLIDVVYKNVNSANCRMDVYYPTDAATPVPCVINMHGGGWVSGAKEEQGGFNMYFNKGYAVVNVEYRMRNETQAPAAVEDVRAAMHYVLNHAQEWNIDTRKIFFQGGSAGGHLALTAGYLQNDRKFDNEIIQYNGEIKVMAVIDKYGAADLTTFLPVYPGMVLWFGTHANDTEFIKSLSPVDLITPNTPPTYIIHGDADPTIPYSQSVTLQAALQAAGVKNKFTTVPGGLHGGFPAAYNTLMETEILTFLDEVLATISTDNKSINLTDNYNIKINKNKVTVDSEKNAKTTVYNMLGKEIISTNLKTFEISEKGFYILKIENSFRNSIVKILIN